MKHRGTDHAIFLDLIEFAKAIGMVALPLRKEQPGYILNSLLVPLLEAARPLLQNEVADRVCAANYHLSSSSCDQGLIVVAL